MYCDSKIILRAGLEIVGSNPASTIKTKISSCKVCSVFQILLFKRNFKFVPESVITFSCQDIPDANRVVRRG